MFQVVTKKNKQQRSQPRWWQHAEGRKKQPWNKGCSVARSTIMSYKMLGRMWEMQMRTRQNCANKSNEKRHWLARNVQNGCACRGKSSHYTKFWLSSHIVPWKMMCNTCIFSLAKPYLFSKRLVYIFCEEAKLRYTGYFCTRLYSKKMAICKYKKHHECKSFLRMPRSYIHR